MSSRELFLKICQLAVAQAHVDHSGFVLFDAGLTTGEVFADYPPLHGLEGKKFDLVDNKVEQEILKDDEPYVIENVDIRISELGEVGDILQSHQIQSLCVVKVYSGKRPVGSFSFDSIGKTTQFDAEKRMQCRAFAELASMVISNEDRASKTLGRLIASQQQKKALNSIIQTLSIGRSLGSVVRSIQEATACDAVVIYPLSENPKLSAPPPETFGLLRPAEVSQNRATKSLSPPGRVLAEYHRRKATNEDPEKYVHVVTSEMIDTDETLRGEFIQREGIRAAIAIPILSSDDTEGDIRATRLSKKRDLVVHKLTPVGILFVNYRTEKDYFSSLDIDTVKVCAHFAAIAIRNAQVYSREQREHDRLEKLYQAASILSLAEDPKDISNQIAKEAYELGEKFHCNVNFSSITLGSGRGEYLVVSAYPPDGKKRLLKTLGNPIRIPDKDNKHVGVVARAIQKKTDRVIKDTRKVRNSLPVPGTKSELVVLIRNKNEILGAINVESRELNAFSRTDFDAYKLLAQLCYDRLEIAKQYFELAEARLIEKSLREVTMYHVRNGLFLHNIKRSAGHVFDAAERIDAEFASPSIKTLLADITQLRTQFSELGKEYLEKATTDLHKEINSFIRNRRTDRFSGVNFIPEIGNIKMGAELAIPAFFFRHILKVFADNALEAFDPSKERLIRLRFYSIKGARCRIEISDNGSGCHAKIWPKLFTRKVTSSLKKDAGIGLLTVALLVREFGGMVEGIDTGSDGTTFAITLRLVRSKRIR